MPLADDISLRFVLMPDLFTPLVCEESQYNGPYVEKVVFSPPAFGGAGWTTPLDEAFCQTYLKALAARFEAVRITSESVTLELIAPALSDQGTITAAQYAFHYQELHRPVQGDVTGASANWAEDYLLFDAYPGKSQLLAGTRAYTSKARDGAYLPLHLDSFEYRYLNNWVARGAAQSSATVDQGASLPTIVALANGEFTDRIGCELFAPRLKPLGSHAGVIYIDSTAGKAAALRLRFRMTIEGLPYPGSVYAPLAEVPPPPDDIALRMYFEISSRMKDAYPASYNDWDKLKNIIVDIGRKVLPKVDPILAAVAKSVPGGAFVYDAAKGIAKGLDVLTTPAAKKNSGRRRRSRGRAPVSKPPNKPLPPTPRKKLSIQRPAK